MAIGFSTDDEIPDTETPQPTTRDSKINRRKALIVGGLAVFLVASGATVGYTASHHDKPATAVVTNQNQVYAPTEPVAVPVTTTPRVPKVPFGSTIEVSPGHQVTVYKSGRVTFFNNGDDPFDISGIRFIGVLADGTQTPGLGQGWWDTVLQPGEKDNAKIYPPAGATVVMVPSQGNDELARWTP